MGSKLLKFQDEYIFIYESECKNNKKMHNLQTTLCK